MYGNNNYYPMNNNKNINGQVNYNPYQQQPYQQVYQPMPVQPTITQPITSGLQGKSVDSIDVVKAMDIPLDGSISYFPLVDGTAIVSKQIQLDGTSKTTIYRPTTDEQVEQPKYATLDDVKQEIRNLDLSDIDDLKEEIRDLKKQLKDLKKKGD